MRNWKTFAIALAVLALPLAASSAGLEFGVGAWYVNPSGSIAYAPYGPNQFIGLSGAGVDEEWQLTFRLKGQPPALPGIYLQAVPMSFSTFGGNGGTDFEFSFGDVLFNPGDEIKSDFFLNVYDAVLYFPIPLIKTATLNVFSAEIGAGGRWITIRAELENRSTDDLLTSSVIDDAQTANVVFPEGYAAVQIRPTEKISLDGEIWGYSWNGDKFWSLVGRLKLKPVGPLMISGGYRYDYYNFEQDDLRLRNTQFKGPFAEIGVMW